MLNSLFDLAAPATRIAPLSEVEGAGTAAFLFEGRPLRTQPLEGQPFDPDALAPRPVAPALPALPALSAVEGSAAEGSAVEGSQVEGSAPPPPLSPSALPPPSPATAGDGLLGPKICIRWVGNLLRLAVLEEADRQRSAHGLAREHDAEIDRLRRCDLSPGVGGYYVAPFETDEQFEEQIQAEIRRITGTPTFPQPTCPEPGRMDAAPIGPTWSDDSDLKESIESERRAVRPTSDRSATETGERLARSKDGSLSSVDAAAQPASALEPEIQALAAATQLLATEIESLNAATQAHRRATIQLNAATKSHRKKPDKRRRDIRTNGPTCGPPPIISSSHHPLIGPDDARPTNKRCGEGKAARAARCPPPCIPSSRQETTLAESDRTASIDRLRNSLNNPAMAISDEDVIDELESSGHAVDDYVIVETDVCIVDRDGRPLPLLIEDYPGEEEGALYYAIIDFLRRRGSPEYRSFEEFDEQADSGEAGSTKSAATDSDRRRTGNTKKQSPWWWTLLACIGVPIAYFFLLQARFFDQEERACAALSLMLGISVSMAVKGRFAGALFFASLLTLAISFVPFGPSLFELFLINAVPGLLSACLAEKRNVSSRARNGP